MGDVLTATQPSLPAPIRCIHEAPSLPCTLESKLTLLGIVKVLVSLAARLSVIERPPPTNSSSPDCKDVWHQHFSISPTEDGKQFSKPKLDELIALLPISGVEELEDHYFDDSNYSGLAANQWVRARSRPGRGTRWIERRCKKDERNGGLELGDREPQNLDALQQTMSTKLVSFKFTRYTLDCRDAGCEGLSVLLDVVDATGRGRFIIVGTVSLPQSEVRSEHLPDECEKFLQRLNNVTLRPVPSKVLQVLSIVASKKAKIAEKLDSLSLPNLQHQLIDTDHDPLAYYKLDAKSSGEEWFEKVHNGYFRNKGYEQFAKLSGYALSVLTLAKLDKCCPHTRNDNERLIAALRMSTQFRFPQLARALRKAPHNLDETDRLLIEQLSVEDLQHYGNVSAARARKMSEVCQFGCEYPHPETAQYFGVDARQASDDDGTTTASTSTAVRKKKKKASAKKKTPRGRRF